MGTLSVQDERGLSRMEMLRRHAQLYPGASWSGQDGSAYRIESMAAGAGGVYAVLAVTKPDGVTYRTAMVILVQRRRGEFSWKTLSECDGPYYYGMPSRLLEQLSPVEMVSSNPYLIENARQWRQRVQAQLSKASVTLKPGDLLEFAQPLTFAIERSNVSVSRFVVVEWGRRRVLNALPAGGTPFLCSLRRDTWQRDYKVIPRA